MIKSYLSPKFHLPQKIQLNSKYNNQMEVLNGVVSNPSFPCKQTHIRNSSIPKNNISNLCFLRKNGLCGDSKKLVAKVGSCGFADKGHLEYYHKNNVICGDKKGKKGWGQVSTKKKVKLLKGLTKDLSTFSELGFGLSSDCVDGNQGFVGGDDQSKIISQAAEVLLAQLKQLRAEEEKMEKEEKEENKKCKAEDSESSSSSSESSDSECDKVVNMKGFRSKVVVQPTETMARVSGNEEPLWPMLSLPGAGELSLNSEEKCSNMILEVALNKDASIEVLNSETSSLRQSNVESVGNSMSVELEGKRVEVCMGGKCKKSGSPAVMEEFRKAIGNEGDVVGCKCMGKCKTAPNVKVVNGCVGENVVDDSLRTPSNPLYIGVGLGDVELIVLNHFAEELKGLPVAGVAS